MRYGYPTRSPYWLQARFASSCACGKRILKGEQVYYYPSSRKAVCEACGLKGASDMADELAMAGEGNPY